MALCCGQVLRHSGLQCPHYDHLYVEEQVLVGQAAATDHDYAAVVSCWMGLGGLLRKEIW